VLAETTLGALAALGSAVTWAVTGLLVRSLMADLGSVAVNALRSSVGGALLLAWVLGTRGIGPFASISAGALALLALSIVAAVTIGDTLFFESTRALGLGRAMTVSMTYPAGSALLAAAFLDEPITPALAAGTLLTLGGLTLIVAPWTQRAPGERFWWGVGAATLASLAWAVSVIILKAPLREIEPVTAQAIRLPLAAATLWVMPWASGALGGLGRRGPSVLARLAALSLLNAVSSVMFVTGVKYAGVAVATVLSSTAPMFAIPLAVVFLGERLSLGALLGAAVTLAGIVVLQL
jgi:drug/metabolite transporter (DMT)-like permease